MFVTLEGPEGAGKSTQAAMLAQALRDEGYDVLATREPGGTALGEELRRLIKHFGGPDDVCPEAEVLMFGASRAQLVRSVVRPHLAGGGVVICDRFADSTTVYQGGARGLDANFVRAMHEFTVGDCWPHLTLLLDLGVDAGFHRARERDGVDGADRIESESKSFHELVRQGFLDLAEDEPDRICVISASADVATIHQTIMEAVHRGIERLR